MVEREPIVMVGKVRKQLAAEDTIPSADITGLDADLAAKASTAESEAAYEPIDADIQTHINAAHAPADATSGDWPVVPTANSTISPTAGDSGKLYICNDDAAQTFNLPASAGCTAGKTRFFIYTSDPSGTTTLTPNGSDTISHTQMDGGTVVGVAGSTSFPVNYGTTAEVRYIGSGIWVIPGGPLFNA